MKNTKRKYVVVATSIMIVVLLVTIINKTFSISNDIYTNCTRKELQNMIVSTAVSYYYNGEYSDYEMYLLDRYVKYPNDQIENAENKTCNLSNEDQSCHSTDNKFIIYATTSFKNLQIKPEEVSSSNEYNSDCSGFTFLVYNNVLGYDSSEFKALSHQRKYTILKNNELVTKKFTNSELEDIVSKYGRITADTPRIENCIIDNQGESNPRSVCQNLENNQTKDLYEEYDDIKYKDKFPASKSEDSMGYVTDNDNETTEVIYKYIFKNYGTDNYSDEKDDWKAKDLEKYFNSSKTDFLLQKGDMIRLSYDSDNGHVMIYVGDVFNTKDAGIIHVTGTSNQIDRINSVRYEANIYNYLDTIFTDKDVLSISILRPINIYCEGDECSNANITPNDEARIDFINTKVEQYVEKDNRIITSYNSVDVGDTLTYSLKLQNKEGFEYCTRGKYATKDDCESYGETWKKSDQFTDNSNTKFKIEFTLPEGTITDDTRCKTTNNKTTCTVNNSSYGTISFKAKINSNTLSKLDSATFKVTKLSSDKTLTLDTIKVNVNTTININDVTKLNNTITNFNISYDIYNNISSINDVNTTTKMNSLDFIKYIYYNNFNIDITSLTGSNIIDSLFQKYNPTQNSYGLNAYFKKNSNDKISNMLVEGMYGGRKLIGNDNSDRIKFISTKNFEVGDIIVVAYDMLGSYDDSDLNYSLTSINPETDLKYYIVKGFDGNYTLLSEFNKNGIFECGSDSKIFNNTTNDINNYKLNNGNKYNCSERLTKHLLYSSSLFAVLRPTQVYNDTTYKVTINYGNNKTKEVDKKYNDKYEGSITAMDSNNGNIKYYSDSNYKNEVTSVNVHSNHEIYALITYDIIYDANGGNIELLEQAKQTKTYDNNLTLSSIIPTREGYNFLGWSTSSNATSATYQPKDIYTENKSITLYAVWSINNPNNTLSKLTINNKNIELKENVYNYDFEVDNNVTSAEIKATLKDSKNKFVSDYGPRKIDNLNIGNNKVEIKIEGQDSQIVTYVINVIRLDKTSNEGEDVKTGVLSLSILLLVALSALLVGILAYRKKSSIV